MRTTEAVHRLFVGCLTVCLASVAAGAEAAGPQVVVPGGYSRQAPANTARPLALAIEDKLDCVELEVRRSKDGQHVIFDADTLDRKSSGGGALKEHTLAELQALDAGSWFAPRFTGTKILSLAEALGQAKDKIRLQLLCHDVDPKQLVRELHDTQMMEQVIVAGPLDVMAQLRKLSDNQLTTCEPYAAAVTHKQANDKVSYAIVSPDECSADFVRMAHTLRLRIVANCDGHEDPASWDKAVAAGVDMVRTRLPEEFLIHTISQRVKNRQVQVAAHRGASRYAPENTFASLEKAARLHADFVEIDVHTTSDGALFLLHDATVDRTTSGHGRVRQLTAETMRTLDAGRWFGLPFVGAPLPELGPYLDQFPRDMGLYFDAKDIAPELLAAAVEKHNLVERTVVYQGPVYLEKLKQLNPRIRTLAPVGAASHVDTLAKRLSPYAVDTSWKLLSPQYIEHCHSMGIKVFADAKGDTTVEQYADAIRWGIDLIQTDHPLRFWRALETREAH